MGSESIAHEAEVWMGYWLQPVGQKISRQNKTSAKRDSAAIVLVFKAGAFRY